MMAEPARVSAAGRGPDDPVPGRPDPGVRRALVTEARACRLAVEEMARHPGDPAVLEMAKLTLSVLEDLREMARGWHADDIVIAAEIDRAVAADRAARPRGRGRLRVAR